MAAADPISARIFKNRAKSSTIKLPPNVVSLPAASAAMLTLPPR